MIENFRAAFDNDSERRYGFIREAFTKEHVLDLLEKFGMEEIEEKGDEIWALCPFHDDSSASWSINIDKQGGIWGVHSCWVCKDEGGKGNIATLTKDMMDLKSYPEALTHLEKYIGITKDLDSQLDLALKIRLRKKDKVRKKEREFTGVPPKLLFSKFTELHKGSEGWKYLNGRGVPEWQIRERGIRLGTGRYVGRVVLPLIMDGEVKSFYARAYDGREPPGLNPKGKGLLLKALYGFDNFDIMEDTCYLVEGAFDVLAVERILLQILPRLRKNVFGTETSILLEGQAKLLAPFKNVVVLPDMKGKALSLVPSCKKLLRDKTLYIVQVPREEDPDSQCRKDPRFMMKKLLSPDRLRDSTIVKRIDYSI